MTELLDTFDEYGNKTGTIKKGEITSDYVKCCSCFVVNRKNQGYLTINPQFELTNDADKNNMIAEVEKLPYFMDFYDEDGELDTHQSNGKVVIFKKG